MEKDIDWMKDFIRVRSIQTWNENQKPYYLSFIATDLAKEDVDYKSLISPPKLRQWATDAEVPGARFVAHPVHKAKAGFVPIDVEFSFDNEPLKDPFESQENRPKIMRAKKERNRHIVMSFLEALSKLSDADLGEVQIPVRVIVRLFDF